MADGKVSIQVELDSKDATKSVKKLGNELDGAFKDKNGRWRAANGRFLTMKEQADLLNDSVGKVRGNFSKFFSSISTTFGGIGNKLTGWGDSLTKVGNSLTKNITKPALIAGAAVTGITLTKGLQRLIGIDTARAKLVGLGHDAQGVEAIMESALQSVKGTSFGMDEAATTAANAVAAGVKEGEALTKYLTITGDAAAIAGSSMADMGAILNSVRTSNKAYNGDLQQLSNRGLPVFQWLADAAGVTAEEIVKMAADGKISSEMLMDAIDKNIGGAAKKMGEESFTAGLANMWAAVGRLGASFLDAGGKGGGFFSQLKPLIADLTNNLDTLGDWAAEMGVKFGEAFTKMIEKIKEIIKWYNELSPLMQGVVKKVALFGSIFLLSIGPAISLVAKLVIGLGSFFTAISQIALGISKLPALFAGIGKAITFLTGPVGITIAVIIAAAILIYKYWEPIKEFFIKLWADIKEYGIIIWDALKKAWKATIDWITNAWDSVSTFFVDLWTTIKDGAVSIWDSVVNAWKSTIDGIINTWTAIKTFFIDLWNSITETATSVWDSVVNVVSAVYTKITTVFAPMISFYKNLFSRVVEVGSTLFGNLVTFLSNTWDNIKTIASSAWEIIKNVILAPILLLIDLITGDFDGFKSHLSQVWDNIKEHASNIWNAIKDIVVGYVTMLWENAKTIFLALVETVIEYFSAIKDTIVNVWETIVSFITEKLFSLQEIFNNAMDYIYGILVSAWTFIDELWRTALEFILGDSINKFEEIKHSIEDAMEAVWNIIETVWNFISETFSNVIGFIMALVRGDFSTMKEFIGQQMNLIKNTISTIWQNVKTIFTSVLSALWGIVKEKFSQIKQWSVDKIQETKDNIVKKWEEAKNLVKQKLTQMWNDTVQKFKDIVKSVTDKMDEAKQKVEDGWNKAVEFLQNIDLKQIGKDIIDGLINGITSKVEAVGKAIKDVTDKITGKIKGILGIHSPSRWMRDMIGKNMMLGWQIGIEREKRSSEKMAEQATDWMTPEVPKVSGFVNKFKGISAPLKDVMSKVTANHTIALAGGGMNANGGSYAVEIVTNLDGKEIAREVVDDITELQNVKKYSNYKSKRKG